MASYKYISERILDPFDKNLYQENTKYSNNILAKESKRLLEILENDSIIDKGLEVLSKSIWDNRKFNIQLSYGKILQDYNLIEIHEDINLDLYLYTHHNIVDLNTSSNWFEVSGIYESYFPVGSTFAVVDSTGNDKLDYSVSNVELRGANTRITVSTGVGDSTIDGKIICRRYPDNFENYGRLVVFTNFDYSESIASDQNILKIELAYLDRNNNISGSFGLHRNSIILAMFEFERNGSDGVADDTEIDVSTFEQINKYENITIEGIEYYVYNESNMDSGLADGGRIV